MGVSLERVQNKFACIIGELCSEPLILSQFAVWVDLRIAEYKTKGTISLDCSGDSPNPSWMKGVKNNPPRGGSASLDTGQGSHHRRGSFAASPAESSLYNERLQPHESSPRHSQNSNSQNAFPTRLSPDIMVIKSEPGTDQQSSCTLSRKRHLEGNDLQSDFYSPSKSRRLGNASSTLSSAAQESSSNQSLMSIINAENDNIVLQSVDTSNTDIFRSTVNAAQNELDATPGFSTNTTFSPRQSTATSSGSSPSQSAWPAQYSSNQSAQGSSSQTVLGCPLVSGSGRLPAKFDSSLMTHDQFRSTTVDPTYQEAPDLSSGLENATCSYSAASFKNAMKSASRFEDYLQTHGIQELRKMEEIPPVELNCYLFDMFSNIVKLDGKPYSVNSLRTLRTGIEHYLKSNNYAYSITNSPEFSEFQQCFRNKKRELRRLEKQQSTS